MGDGPVYPQPGGNTTGAPRPPQNPPPQPADKPAKPPAPIPAEPSQEQVDDWRDGPTGDGKGRGKR
jgi:hypothetical protein